MPGGPRGWWDPGPLTCVLSTPCQTRGAGGGRVSLGEGDELDRTGTHHPPLHPPEFRESRSRGEGPHPPPPRFPWEARGGRRWLIPTPSLTLRARAGRGGGAEPQTTKSGAARGSPSPGRLGVAAAGPSPDPSPGASPIAPGSPPRVGSQKQCRGRLGRCDSDTRVPRDAPNTDTQGGTARRRGQGQRGPGPAAGTRGNQTAALTPAQTAEAPAATPAQTRPATRTAAAAPSPPASRSHPRRPPTQTHKSHTQPYTRTDSRARLFTLGATRRPQAGRVCTCVTRRHLPALLSHWQPRFHPRQAAPPGPPPRRPSPSASPRGCSPRPGRPLRPRSEEVLTGLRAQLWTPLLKAEV